MAKTVNRLSEVKARKAGPGLYPDGDGLYLQVRSATARSWIYRYTFAGKAREMGLGAFPSTPLELARLERDKFKRLKLSGEDPIQSRDRERMATRAAQDRAITFTDAAAAFIRDRSDAWKNEKHRQQWTNTLVSYVYPTIGHVAVADIDTQMVKKVLEPIWRAKPETASRIRGRIEAILDSCRALGYRTGDNPARWRGNLEEVLPSKMDLAEVEHHPALPYVEIPKFFAELRAQQSVAARALEWIILTASRANEALKAVPDEISRTDRCWIVPKVRMKGRRGQSKPHRVPVQSRVLDILDSVPRCADNPYIFQGKKAGRHLSDASLRVLLGRMGVSDRATTHGFRATFRTWAAERTSFAWEVCEKAIAHSVGDETERAYDRGDLFDRRRELMEAWADYCMSRMKISANVVRTAVGYVAPE